MDKKQAYKILGAIEGCSEEELKKSYRKKAFNLHPDRNPGNKEAEEKFKQLTQAYELLTKPQKDNPFISTDFNDHFQVFEELNRMWENLHSSQFNHRQRRQLDKLTNPALKTIKYQDILLTNVPITLINLLLKLPVRLQIDVSCSCPTCLASEENWIACAMCGQHGSIVNSQKTGFGIIQNVATCPTCRGLGWKNKLHCKNCNDRLEIKKTKTIECSIPTNFQLGHQIRIKGAGHEGWNALPSDILISPIIVFPTSNIFKELSIEEQTQLTQILHKLYGQTR